MKNINQFDYPSRQAQSFKSYSQNQMFDTNDKTNYQKTKYKQNLQFHMQMQRNKVKQNDQKKRQLQAKKHKAKIYSQLQKKKKQLETLQHMKQQAYENQKKAHQLALIKQEQDKIKRQDDQRKKKQFDENAVNRFQTALKRLYQQKEETNFKDRLAEQRRKTAEEFQRIQRIKASKYKSIMQQKQKNIQKQELKSFQEYKKTLGRSAYNKNTDYSKTCLHNPKIIVQNQISQQNAFQKGKLTAEIQRQRSQQRRKQNDDNLRRSKQRGRQALLKMQRERQYQQFQKETQQEQRQYNLHRIQAGKKDQFIGIKPTTLSQMQNNKILRSQEEFDRMFFAKPVNVTQNFNKTASRFDIVDRTMPNPNQNIERSEPKTQKQKLRQYLKSKQQSQIPCVSEGKYSFQQPQYSDFKNQSRSRSHQQIDQQNQENEQQVCEQRQYPMKNAWRQTGIPNQKYTSSPQQQKKISRGIKRQQKKVEQVLQKDNFNTDQMMRKYGLKKDSPQKMRNTQKNINNGQKKRKVVQLANICQNKNQKQQLSYSQSQQDSLM